MVPSVFPQLHIAREAGPPPNGSNIDVDARSFDCVRHIGMDRLSHCRSDTERGNLPRDTRSPPFADSRGRRTRGASPLGARSNTSADSLRHALGTSHKNQLQRMLEDCDGYAGALSSLLSPPDPVISGKRIKPPRSQFPDVERVIFSHQSFHCRL